MKIITKILALCAALCGMSAGAETAWDNYGYDGVSLIGYVRSDTESVDTSERAAAYCLCDDTNPGGNSFTINQLTVKSGDDIRITPNPWHTSWKFGNLTVNALTVGSSGDVKLNVYADNSMTIKKLTGGFSDLTVNGTLVLSDYCTEVDFNVGETGALGPADTLPLKNGYTGKCTVGYTIKGDGTVTFLDNTKFKLNGSDATYDKDAKTVGGAEVDNGEGKVYYVVDGVVDSDYVSEAALVYVGPNGTLDLGDKYSDTNKQDLSDLTALLGKVKGTGTISISGRMPDQAFPVSAFSGTGCAVKMAGVSAWFSAGATIPFDMILADSDTYSGLEINGANNGATYTFTGNISGDGSFKYAQSDWRSCTIKMTGDATDWTGSFINCNNGATVWVPSTVNVVLNEGRIAGTKTDSGLTGYVTRSTDATDVYAHTRALTAFFNADGFQWASICDGDTIVLDSHYTDDQWNVQGPNFPADHKVVLGKEMNVKSGIPTGRTVTVNASVYLYGDIAANATIDGSGVLDLGYNGSCTIKDGVTISTAATKIGDASRKVYIDGEVSITSSTMSITGAITLKKGATLTTAVALTEDQITTDAGDGYYVVTDETTHTYTVSNMYTVTFDPAVTDVTFKQDGVAVSGDYSFEYGATVSFTVDYDTETLVATVTKNNDPMTPTDGVFSFTMGTDTVTISATTAAKPQEDVPSTKDDIKVPSAWAKQYNITAENVDSPAACGKFTNAQCYALGLDPTDEDADWTVSISFDAAGKPVITSDPATAVQGKIKIIGSKNLKDWNDKKDDDLFFRAEWVPAN